MAFPYHDRLWVDTADFVSSARQRDTAILAPDLFMWRFDRIHTYDATFRNPDLELGWAVLHKDQLNNVSIWALAHIDALLRPLFANEVFVVFGSAAELEAVDETDPHLRSYAARLAERRDSSDSGPADESQRPIRVAQPEIRPEPGALFKFDALTLPELRSAMNSFYSQGGYEFPTARDRALRAEVARKIERRLEVGPGQRALDIGCGEGFALEMLGAADSVVAVDLSDVALQHLLDVDELKAGLSVAVMDGEHLAFPDNTFDVVTCIETIEHVLDAQVLLNEAARVLRPGGQFLVSTANTDSLHLRLQRKLGYPEFETSYQHIQEFALGELSEALALAGLQVEASDGIFLYPYFGLPGIDEIVRAVEDDDDEIIEALRSLGDTAEPEYAYEVLVTASKARAE